MEKRGHVLSMVCMCSGTVGVYSVCVQCVSMCGTRRVDQNEYMHAQGTVGQDKSDECMCVCGKVKQNTQVCMHMYTMEGTPNI